MELGCIFTPPPRRCDTVSAYVMRFGAIDRQILASGGIAMEETAMNPVVHFEMPAEDTARMAQFYSRTFGWTTRQLGPEMGNYVLAATTETDEYGRPTRVGIINGGFYPKNDEGLAQYPSVVIAVEDLPESMRKIKENGGEVLDGPMDIPGIGLYVLFSDTEKNRVGMLQPLAMEEPAGIDTKEAAQSFLRMVAAREIEQAYEKYIHPEFRHHNAYFQGDRQSLLKAMLESHAEFPKMTLEIQRTLEDGNLVAVHSRIQLDKNKPMMAVVHIFRFEGAQIIEFWDIAQEIPQDSPNQYGAF